MKRKKSKSSMAAAMAVVMLGMMCAPAMAGESAPGLQSLTRELKAGSMAGLSVHSSSDGTAEDTRTGDAALNGEATSEGQTDGSGAVLVSNDSMEVEFAIDGEARESISFYMVRDMETNLAPLPEPVILTVTQNFGPDFGEVQVDVSAGLNDGITTRVEVQPVGDTYLRVGSPVTFRVSFVDESVANGGASVYTDGERNYITISGGGVSKNVPVYYGADGFYSFYSAESAARYEGEVIEDSGNEYRLIGTVNLNDAQAPSFTIRHRFGVYADMEGMDEQGNPVPLRICRLYLDPDGMFTFSDGSVEMEAVMGEDNWISIPLQMKASAFQDMRIEAALANRRLAYYRVLEELIMEYNDGYLAGGRVGVLPLVYEVVYTPAKRTGGGSGGGGGGSSSSSGGSSGTTSSVVGPSMTPRVTNFSAGDIGWVKKEDGWYYLDAANNPITGWLFAPDSRWYYLAEGGLMKTGWLSIGSIWYFLNADGAMATGWVQGADGNWYYLQQSGAMATDMITPDGYYVDKEGVWR